jgi:hypothetical protein
MYLMPSIGYGSAKATRHMMPSGFRKVCDICTFWNLQKCYCYCVRIGFSTVLAYSLFGRTGHTRKLRLACETGVTGISLKAYRDEMEF